MECWQCSSSQLPRASRVRVVPPFATASVWQTVNDVRREDGRMKRRKISSRKEKKIGGAPSWPSAWLHWPIQVDHTVFPGPQDSQTAKSPAGWPAWVIDLMLAIGGNNGIMGIPHGANDAGRMTVLGFVLLSWSLPHNVACWLAKRRCVVNIQQGSRKGGAWPVISRLPVHPILAVTNSSLADGDSHQVRPPIHPLSISPGPNVPMQCALPLWSLRRCGVRVTAFPFPRSPSTPFLQADRSQAEE